MCSVSMIMDHQYDEWQRRLQQWQPPAWPYQPYQPPPIRPEEVEEFRRLLDRAREYDRKNNEPDCELEEKRQKLRDLADTLGVKIDFV